jgi:hypothetical protein
MFIYLFLNYAIPINGMLVLVISDSPCTVNGIDDTVIDCSGIAAFTTVLVVLSKYIVALSFKPEGSNWPVSAQHSIFLPITSIVSESFNVKVPFGVASESPGFVMFLGKISGLPSSSSPVVISVMEVMVSMLF